jgi:hypothetical protein
MKQFSVLAASLLAFVPASLAAGPLHQPDGRQDLGCSLGWIQAGKFPTTVYDSKTHERVSYNLSACTGGYIKGVSADTWKSWNADVTPGGAMAGRDLNGDRWSYDPKARLYTNVSTGRTCSQTSLREVC